MMLGASKEESVPSRAGESIPGIYKEWLASIVVLTTRSLYECGLYGQTVHLQHGFPMPSSSCLFHNLCAVDANSP